MRSVISALLMLCVLLASLAASPARAASAFAAPAFDAQWAAGEAVAPNFWGPLAQAKEGQQEDYAEATGGKRLVQYFDKGRMELGADGAVTSGLLAQELISGRVQIGNVTSASRTPYDYPIVGDPRPGGLTYARIARTPEITAPTPMGDDALGVFRVGPSGAEARGEATTYYATTTYAGRPILAQPAYDEATRQYVVRAFADYRDKVGIATVGYALTPPIYEVVPLGGKPATVLYQVFQRRVLTFNATNPAAFQVEMGNTGQHYYQWRYSSPAASISGQAQAPGGGQTTTVTDRMKLVRLTLPPGWSVDASSAARRQGLVLVGPTDRRTESFIIFEADAIAVPSFPTNNATADIVQMALASGSFTNVATGNVTDVSVNGDWAKRVPFTAKTSSGAPLFGVVYLFLHGGQLYSFIGGSTGADLSELDAIVRSAVFTNGTSGP